MRKHDCAGNDPANTLMANSYYTNHTNFGMATVRFKPEKRVSNVGYSITSVDGGAAVQHFAASRDRSTSIRSRWRT